MSENQQFTETIKRESVELQELANGKVVKITASGKLTKASYDFFIPELDNLVEKHGKIRLLFEMIEFQGWTRSRLGGSKIRLPAFQRHRTHRHCGRPKMGKSHGRPMPSIHASPHKVLRYR